MKGKLIKRHKKLDWKWVLPLLGFLIVLLPHASFYSEVLTQKQNIGSATTEESFEFSVRKLTLTNALPVCVTPIKYQNNDLGETWLRGLLGAVKNYSV